MSSREPQTEDEALDLVRRCAARGRVEIVWHAIDRAFQRSVTERSIRDSLQVASAASPGNSLGRWLISGDDQDGDPIVLVIEFDVTGVSPDYDWTIVVTVRGVDDG